MIELETERLVLRQLESGDFESYAQICADPEVMRYLGLGPSMGKPMSRIEAWRSLAMMLGHWQLRGYGMWAVVEKSSGQFVGRVGLHNPEGWPGPEVGWTLGREYWGRGFASEAGQAAMQYAFDALDLRHILSVIHPENRNSIRVAERLGMQFERTWDLMGVGVSLYGRDR